MYKRETMKRDWGVADGVEGAKSKVEGAKMGW